MVILSAMRKIFVIAILITISSVMADDITTLRGEKFKGVTVRRVEPDGLVVVKRDGIVKIPFTDLSPEVRGKYGYDQQKAAEFYAERQAATAEFNAAAKAAAVQRQQVSAAAEAEARQRQQVRSVQTAGVQQPQGGGSLTKEQLGRLRVFEAAAASDRKRDPDGRGAYYQDERGNVYRNGKRIPQSTDLIIQGNAH